MASPPAFAQLAPLVPLGESQPESPLLPAGVSRNKPEAFGQYAQVWTLADGTHVMQYYGDFALHLGARRLTSRDAVIWMRKTAWKDLNYYHYEVFLSQDAMVRDAAGTVSSGPTLFVTFNAFESIDLEMDSSSEAPSAETVLYKEASKVREQVAAGGEATEPVEMAVTDLALKKRRERPKPRPIVRYRSNEKAIIDEKAGTVTITGDVYLSQGLVESGQFTEIRANAAVLFLRKEEAAGVDKDKQPKDPLDPERSADRAPKPAAGDRLAPTVGFGSIGAEGGGTVTGVYLKGDVVLSRGERMIRASELYYDLENDRALILDAVMRAVMPDRELPLYIRAAQVRQLSSTEYMARKARVSTSEFYTPHVHLGAERIYLTDATPRTDTGEVLGLAAGKYRAYDVTTNLEGVPISYWPYLAGDFRAEQSPLRGLRVSYGDDFGMSVESKWYLFNILGTEKPKGVDAILLMDYFGKRGPGVGLNVDYETENSFGLFRGYYINDHGEDDLGPYRDGNVENDDRGRLTWRHRQYLPQDWQLTLEGSYISDDHFLEEYFNNEFETGKEQETLIYLKKQRDNWAFTALAQWRVLDFLTQTEHLPDLGFNWIGEPLGEIANYYNDSRIGFVRHRPDDRYFFTDNDLGTNQPDHIKSDLTFRADTRNEVDFPIKLGSTQIVPYAMARPGYWDGSAEGGSAARLFGSMGIRTGTQFWRVFDNVVSKLLDVYGVRHIIKPEWTAWVSGSNKDSNDLYAFDRGVEDIDDFYGSSLALRQRWQTKRGGPGNWRVVDWIKLDLELNLFGGVPKYTTDPIGRYYDSRPENSNARDHVRSDFSFRISDTATLLADSNWNLNDGSMDLFNVSYAVEYTPRFSYVLGYRRIGPTDSNLVGAGVNYELNSKYKMAVAAYYDLERNELETFDVTLIRRWPRWYSALTFGLDNVEDDIHLSLSVWPEGAPQMALGSRKYTGLSQGTGIRPEQ
jgi:hypothetical protein